MCNAHDQFLQGRVGEWKRLIGGYTVAFNPPDHFIYRGPSKNWLLFGHLHAGLLSSLCNQVCPHTMRPLDLSLPLLLLLVGAFQVAFGGQSDTRGLGQSNLGPAKLLTNCTRVCRFLLCIYAIC